MVGGGDVEVVRVVRNFLLESLAYTRNRVKKGSSARSECDRTALIDIEFFRDMEQDAITQGPKKTQLTILQT